MTSAQIRKGGALLGVALAAILTGCSQTNNQPGAAPDIESIDLSAYADVKATVSYENYTVVYPIDAYYMSVEDGDVIATAYYLQFEACMKEHGANYTIPSYLPSNAEIGFRRYGIWNSEEAASFGYGLPPAAPEDDGPLAQLSEKDLLVADQDCAGIEYLTYVEAGAVPSDGSDAALFIAPGIGRTAYEMAQKDPRWASVDSEYYECVEDAGYTIDESAMGPTIPEDQEGAIRAALLAASCSKDVDRVQRLADIEAQFQAALIDQQQAALNESLEQQKLIVEKARGIVESYS
ncbi:hypothetical protein C5B85_18250 [Pseudoclavibacter sp. AY1F1]|uniref:hypothetical protein n=1 Tax=Pseudoclavibacter sp. AY1F1 TaxID=2080583 RepID=UPI000CE83950|nr:hypothetical protein [Pseudoclavibacter sp. AY1F1]PPF41863.1 hypothetical protein C5B85_18250 [Pseudoclavibacter sp. AY1F1]